MRVWSLGFGDLGFRDLGFGELAMNQGLGIRGLGLRVYSQDVMFFFVFVLGPFLSVVGCYMFHLGVDFWAPEFWKFPPARGSQVPPKGPYIGRLIQGLGWA